MGVERIKVLKTGLWGREALRLAIFAVCGVFEQATDTKLADVLLGCFGWYFQLFGNKQVHFAVELWRQVVKKGLPDNVLTCCGIAFGGWQ